MGGRGGCRRPLLLAVLAVLFGFLPALAGFAQETTTTPTPTPTARLDTDKATLDGIEAALTRADLSDTALQQLRTQIDPVAVDLQAAIADLQPRVDAAKARLAQLGPKPDPKAAGAVPEAADITADRGTQEKLFNDLDAVAKRARVLLVQASQLDTTIGGLRRGLFTRSVLAQSYSLLDPRLWGPVIRELPSDGRAIAFLWSDWYNGVLAKLPGWQMATIVATLVVLLLLYEPAQRVARRVAGRDDAASAPTRLRKVLAALWVVVLTTVVPAAGLAIAALVLQGFDVITSRLAPLAGTLLRSTLILALIVGLARGFLAPRRAVWRLAPIRDTTAERIYRAAMLVGILVGVTRVITALNDTIAVGLPTAVASRGLLTVLAVVVIAVTQDRLGDNSEEAGKAAARKAQGRDWNGALRLLFWSLTVAAVGALLTGFVAFAAFLIEQTAFVSSVVVALTMLLALVDESQTVLFDPGRGLGRMMIHTLGLRRNAIDVLAILLAGVVRVVLIGIAILLVLAPWRIESGDMLSTMEGAFFGFAIGDVVISPSSIAIAVVLFLVTIGVTHAVQRWLEGTLLPRTQLDSGLQNSIKTSLGYVGVLIASALGLSQLGVSFERLAIVAGALSVGIGFGLQSIVNNFVSGLILLWERAIRVGDWIVVGDDQGYVRRINVRSTEIETFDRATVIVPNSNLVSGVVKNWLRNDRVGRIRLPFTIGFDADPEAVRTILIAEAKADDHVLAIPSPQVLLTALGEANMRLELVCYIEDVETAQRVTSDLLFAILGRLRAIGLMQPAGPPTLASPVLDKLDAWLSAKVGETGNGAARP